MVSELSLTVARVSMDDAQLWLRTAVQWVLYGGFFAKNNSNVQQNFWQALIYNGAKSKDVSRMQAEVRCSPLNSGK